MKFWRSVEDTSKKLEQQCPEKDVALGIQLYIVRFLKYNNLDIIHSEAEAPVTPDRIFDTGFLDVSWKDHLTEENLFYTVPTGALETYRRSIESHVLQCEVNAVLILSDTAAIITAFLHHYYCLSPNVSFNESSYGQESLLLRVFNRVGLVFSIVEIPGCMIPVLCPN
ncbi:Hypothetical predicted protein [Olea europaea subsp. europaea]|uniref:Uncharacterized protein n=1 Tax=Olea europaea subsp. europaea TaxID=158383 RepID=A0A8S0S1M4_OLEEU|nr:Hypothetical predicted protein [Olea europaea subsp. europaea]